MGLITETVNKAIYLQRTIMANLVPVKNQIQKYQLMFLIPTTFAHYVRNEATRVRTAYRVDELLGETSEAHAVPKRRGRVVPMVIRIIRLQA
jgi:hypothetical protein